jgi:hypothetical protein
MVDFWKRHSLSIILGSLFFGMVAISYPLGYYMWDGKGVYFWWWLAQTVFSCEADMGGALILVLATKWFFEYKSAASRDFVPGTKSK